MKKSILIAAVALVVIVVIASGFVGYNAINGGQPAASPTPSPSSEDITQTEARETVMMFLGSNHTEIQTLTESITWTGGRATPEGLVGYETYIYTGNGWNITIGNAVIPEPTYAVSATYTANGAVVVDWQGTYFHSEVNETSYRYSK